MELKLEISETILEKIKKLAHENPEKRLWEIVNLPEVREILLHSEIHKVCKEMLGNGYQVSSCSTNTLRKGNRSVWHVDHPYQNDDTTFPIKSIQVNVAIDDFTKENGATLFDRKNPYALEIKAGNAVYYPGYIWHSAGSNITDIPRTGLLLNFALPEVDPFVPYTSKMLYRQIEENDKDFYVKDCKVFLK